MIWTAVASAERHRFRTREMLPEFEDAPPARKRHRRFALPAQSKVPAPTLLPLRLPVMRKEE